MHSFYNSLASISPIRITKWLAIGFVFWIGCLILTPFPHYLPPDFGFGFLSNKADFFFRTGYFIGFYLHICTAPIGLFLGGLQMSRTVRNRFPSVHRIAGRVYVAAVLFAAAPGGLIMSMKAYGGWSTTICFGLIAIGTWWATFAGWRAACLGEYERHRIWMMRSYVLMLSAVFLRVGHYALQPLDLSPQLTYQAAAWLSWIVPLGILECVSLVLPRSHRSRQAGSLSHS